MCLIFDLLKYVTKIKLRWKCAAVWTFFVVLEVVIGCEKLACLCFTATL